MEQYREPRRKIKAFPLEKYGNLTAIKFLGIKGRGQQFYLCICGICGGEKAFSSHHLKQGFLKSCGCVRGAYEKHGFSKKQEYGIWKTMLRRCTDPKWEGYHNYGGRGISVCDRWMDSYENFIEDVGDRPSLKHQIDRKNNDGNYDPDNVVWSTDVENKNNTRANVFLTFGGKTQTVAQWAREIGMGYSTLKERIKHGWPVEKALFSSTSRKKGRKQPWLAVGLNMSTWYYRKKRGLL